MAAQVSCGRDFCWNYGGYGRSDHSHFSSIVVPAASVHTEYVSLSSPAPAKDLVCEYDTNLLSSDNLMLHGTCPFDRQ